MNKVASRPTVLREIQGPSMCDLCGAPGLKTELVRDPFFYGVGNEAVELSADIPVHSCAKCDASYTGTEAERIEHDAVCRHLGLLTPDEIQGIRKRYGLSRAAFARLTGFGKASLARWERGEVVQNTSSDRYLRLLVDPEIFRRLASLAGLEDPEDGTTRSTAPSPMGLVVSIASGR
ncbi:MAG: type II toxin-antitoxin system MqsA family antitoxin [Gemmatimonadota bacterium]|nr:type II toxin-antitoxin system MqsA family antitoxin [Gemmatimonadota bacterium]MDE2866424.1 type II toxin-antitoxin system MqsA family antitoxin [Gemmatimonadota bacterium]